MRAGTICLNRPWKLEHMRPAHWVAGTIFDLLNPLAIRMSGANINRRTIDNIRKAGLQIESERDLFGTVVKLIVCTKDTP